MLQALQTRSQAYQGWLKQVEALLDGEHVGDKPGQERVGLGGGVGGENEHYSTVCGLI